MFQRGAHCIEMLHSYQTVPANFTRKCLGRKANPLQLSKTLAVLIASCICIYGLLGPHSFLVNIQNDSKGRALHWNVAFIPNCSRKFYKETLGAQGQPTATLKDFGCSDCFLQLCKWSAWSQLNPCKYSECFKGARTALKCCNCTQTFIWCYQTVL